MLKRSSTAAQVAAAALALAVPVLAAPVLAQAPADTGAPEAAPDQRAQSFEAVQGAVKEDVPGGPLLVMGYGILWVALLVYLIRLVRLQQRTQHDLARLERVLAQGSTKK
jgi:hypothetical protein